MNASSPADQDNSSESSQPRTALLPSRIILWLVVLGLGILFLPLYLTTTAIKDDNLRLQAELTDLQEALEGGDVPGPEEQELSDTLLQIRGQIREVETFHDALSADSIDWSATMLTIGNYDQTQMIINALSQTDNLILLNGRANTETIVIAYARELEESGQFERVIVQSIAQNSLPTPTEVEPTPTALPDAGDGTPVDPDLHDAATPACAPIEAVEFTILVESKTGLP